RSAPPCQPVVPSPILAPRPVRRGTRREDPREAGMDLFARVRERVLDGTLWPLTDPHVVGSSGTGQPCAVCDETITVDQTDYEVAGPVMIVHVHVACYHAWSGESQRSA